MGSTGFVKFIDIFHQRGDGGVELAFVNVGGDFFDCVVANAEIAFLERRLTPAVAGFGV